MVCCLNCGACGVWLLEPGHDNADGVPSNRSFYHTARGLQVREDRVYSGTKIAALIGLRLGGVALAVAGIVAAPKIASVHDEPR